MTDRNAPTKAVVIGGGYAGTMAANHLRMRGTGAHTERFTHTRPLPAGLMLLRAALGADVSSTLATRRARH